MAIENGYCTQLEAKAWLRLADASLDDLIVDSLVETASRIIDAHCGQPFYTVNDIRIYHHDGRCCTVDPVADPLTASVSVDDGSLTYPTTWTAGTNFRWEPVNSVVDGIAGHPATSIRLLPGIIFPISYWGFEVVQVTASFGWADVPQPVKQATLHLIAELWKRKDAGPYGTIGSQEFGSMILSADAMRPTVALLRPYRTGYVVGAMA